MLSNVQIQLEISLLECNIYSFIHTFNNNKEKKSIRYSQTSGGDKAKSWKVLLHLPLTGVTAHFGPYILIFNLI